MYSDALACAMVSRSRATVCWPGYRPFSTPLLDRIPTVHTLMLSLPAALPWRHDLRQPADREFSVFLRSFSRPQLDSAALVELSGPLQVVDADLHRRQSPKDGQQDAAAAGAAQFRVENSFEAS